MKPLFLLLAAASLVGAEPGLKLNEGALGSLQQDAGAPPEAPPDPPAKELTALPELDTMAEAEVERRLNGSFARMAAQDSIVERREIYKTEVFPLLQTEPQHARRLLRGMLKHAPSDPQLREEIKTALRDVHNVAAFALKISLADMVAVGDSIDVRAEIRNIDDRPRWAVRSVDKSDLDDGGGKPRRYPHFKVEIWDPDGKKVPLTSEDDPLPHAGLTAEDFTLLAPEGRDGDRFDPFNGKNAIPNRFLSGWTPVKPGRHVLKLTVDYRSPRLAEWKGDDDELAPRFSQLPKVAFSDSIAFDVAPKR